MRRLLAALVGSAAILPACALAQDDPQAGSATVLEEITVTADKREEKQRDVPASLTAFDSTQIEDRNIRDIADVATRTPNFFQSKPGGRSGATTLNIRGVSSANSDFANPTVSVFVDGVKRGGGYDIDFFDVERVEVLRGPQGTIYGGNTLGGAINVINRKPQFEWDAVAEQTIGTNMTFEEKAAVGGPINDQLAFRLTGWKTDSNGYIRNTYLGQSAETRDDLSGRAQLRWTPTPQWDINLNISAFSYRGRYAAYAPLSELKDKKWKTQADIPGRALQTDASQILDVTYKADAFQVTSISAHRFWRSSERLDVDYTGDSLATDKSTKRSDQWSQEFRISSLNAEGDRFEWLVGGFFSDEDQRTTDDFFVNPPLYGFVDPTNMLGAVDVRARNAAVFGQGTYKLTDQLSVTGGLRYDHMRKSLDSSSGYLTPTSFTPGTPKSGTENYGAFLPKVAVEYRWTPEIMSYGLISRGYKPGGFQTYNPTSADIAYDSQYSTNYEVGLKTEFFDKRLFLNVSAFYIDIKKEQFSTYVTPNIAVLQNVGRSHSKGVEADFRWLVTPEFETFGSIGFLKAEVDRLDKPTAATHVGARPAHVPSYTGAIGGKYTFTNGLYATVEAHFIGKYYLDFNNTVKQSSFALLNASVGYKYKNFDFSVYGKNLTNKAYLVRAFGGTLANQGYVGRQAEGFSAGAIIRAKF